MSIHNRTIGDSLKPSSEWAKGLNIEIENPVGWIKAGVPLTEEITYWRFRQLLADGTTIRRLIANSVVR